jgi:hypothetical protein
VTALRPRPADPVLDFIYDPVVRRLVTAGSASWPYSRLSASRVEKIGYTLVVLRCAQIGIGVPSRDEARAWGQR